MRPRSFEPELPRQKRIGARAPFLNTGKRALHFLRFIIVREGADAQAGLGRSGLTLNKLAHFAEIGAARNMETASHYENVRNTARSHVALERGSVGAIRGGLTKLIPERLTHCLRPAVRVL